MTDYSADAIRQHVEKILAAFTHPTLKKDLIALNALKKCTELNAHLYLHLELPFYWQDGYYALQEACSDALCNATGAKEVVWSISYSIATLKRANNQPAVSGVKNIIAISSGKGGVGKSSVAVNLALALAQGGCRVGILDADIYGPSIPLMLGTENERPTSPDGEHMAPVVAYNIESNSIGYLTSDENAMVWRGPMASKALLQLLQETLWNELDYLVIDMPPGTGDIQLTLAQAIPVTGAVVVTTPQDIALADAMKGVIMFKQVNVPILGIVENMSFYICSHCGHHENLFGHGGAAKLAEKQQLTLLAQLPLHATLREDLDQGEPTVIRRPDSEFTQQFIALATRVATELYWQTGIAPAEIKITSLT